MRDLERYFRVESAEEAVERKREFGGAAAYLAGGTDLLVHRPARVRAVIDLRSAGLEGIRRDAEGVTIGAGALLRDVERAVADVAGGMLATAVRETAPWLVRNSATLAGNLANASPAADGVTALIALDAELNLLGNGNEQVPAPSILEGPHRTSLGDRLIQSIRIPAAALNRVGVFIKHARSKSDIAQVNLALTVRLDGGVMRDVRVVLGAVAPTVMRVSAAERFLEGREPDAATLVELEIMVRDEVRPISDWRASEEYRRRISGVLARRALEQIVATQGRNEVA